MGQVKDQYFDSINEWLNDRSQDANMAALHDNYPSPFASAVSQQLARSNAALLAASRTMQANRKAKREAREARLAVRFGRSI
jgi:hypothetical protein